MNITNKLHMHVWEDPNEEPMECLDLTWTDAYPNMSTGTDYPNDGYIQFGADMSDGRWVELRIPFDMIPELKEVAEQCQRNWEGQK